jgi:hypothetical protein
MCRETLVVNRGVSVSGSGFTAETQGFAEFRKTALSAIDSKMLAFAGIHAAISMVKKVKVGPMIHSHTLSHAHPTIND